MGETIEGHKNLLGALLKGAEQVLDLVSYHGCMADTRFSYARVGGKPHVRKGYQGEADYFGVYSPETGKVYLVPVEEAPVCSAGRLRLNPTKNNQQKGVKWAKDYEI